MRRSRSMPRVTYADVLAAAQALEPDNHAHLANETWARAHKLPFARANTMGRMVLYVPTQHAAVLQPSEKQELVPILSDAIGRLATRVADECKYTINQNRTRTSATKSFRLFDLPRDLIDLIFRAVAQGNADMPGTVAASQNVLTIMRLRCAHREMALSATGKDVLRRAQRAALTAAAQCRGCDSDLALLLCYRNSLVCPVRASCRTPAKSEALLAEVDSDALPLLRDDLSDTILVAGRKLAQRISEHIVKWVQTQNHEVFSGLDSELVQAHGDNYAAYEAILAKMAQDVVRVGSNSTRMTFYKHYESTARAAVLQVL